MEKLLSWIGLRLNAKLNNFIFEISDHLDENEKKELAQAVEILNDLIAIADRKQNLKSKDF